MQSLVPKLISFLVFIFLARYLSAADIGIAGAIAAILAIAELVAEQGMGEALVQRRRITRSDLKAAFLVVLGMAVVVATITYLAAGLIATALKVPELEGYIRAVSFYIPIAGLGVVPQAMHKRALEFRPLAARSAISAVVSALVAV
ncbi:MAG: oligosaccharide flippase family protein, partial [Hyphomicrobiaceae bacterium]